MTTTLPIPYANTMEGLSAHLSGADKPVLVDFTATWCGPCQGLVPVLDALASEADDYTILKVDADENAEAAEHYQVQGLPTLILFEDGEELVRIVGALSKPALAARLEPFI